MKATYTSLLALALAAGLASPVLAGDPDEIIAAEHFEFTKPELLVGDPAPSLSVTNWVKGDEVTSFQTGHIYVVEFWATWCGPCIRGMPHLTELQEQFDGDVTVIGVNIWDRKDTETAEQRVTRVSEWVGNNENMGYTVAIDGEKKMEETWMAPGGRDGIPSAFVVDAEGTIAWIGNPLATPPDEVITQMLAGEWNTDEAADHYLADMKGEAWLNHIFGLFQAKEWDHAYELAGALLERDLSETSQTLNQLSWVILTHPAIEERDIALALKAAERACELTDWESSDILDTLAKAYFMNGEVDKCLETMDKAIEHAPTDADRATYEATRAEYAGGAEAR